MKEITGDPGKEGIESVSEPKNSDQEGKIRNALRRANWANVIASLALLVSVFSTGYSVWVDYQKSVENFIVVGKRFFADYPTKITRFPQSGLIDTIWQVDISNVGPKTISITEYDVFAIGQEEQGIWYSGLDKGLYDYNLAVVRLPIVVEPGHSTRIYIRIGAILDPSSWSILESRKLVGHDTNISEVLRILHENRVDIYGNLVESIGTGEAKIFSFRARNGEHREQIFVIRLRTAAGTSRAIQVSWYRFSGVGN